MAAVPQARGAALALSPRKPNGRLEGLYNELEELAARLGLPVVLDRGPFTGGACLLEGEELIVLNKSTPLEQRTRLLAEALSRKDLSGIYLKPAVRAIIEDYQEMDSSWEGSR